MLDDDGQAVRATARSYDINEMLGTKMRALMQREHGRDLFDLVHAWRLSEAGSTPYPVDGAKAMDAFVAGVNYRFRWRLSFLPVFGPHQWSTIGEPDAEGVRSSC